MSNSGGNKPRVIMNTIRPSPSGVREQTRDNQLPDTIADADGKYVESNSLRYNARDGSVQILNTLPRSSCRGGRPVQAVIRVSNERPEDASCVYYSTAVSPTALGMERNE